MLPQEKHRHCIHAIIAGAVGGLFVMTSAVSARVPDATMPAPGLSAIFGRGVIRATFERNFGMGRNTIVFDDVRSEIAPASGEPIRLRGRSLVYFKLADARAVLEGRSKPGPGRKDDAREHLGKDARTTG